MKFCNGCKNLTPTEEEQDKQALKVPHWCKSLRQTLFHERQHPNIVRPLNCEKWRRISNE